MKKTTKGKVGRPRKVPALTALDLARNIEEKPEGKEALLLFSKSLFMEDADIRRRALVNLFHAALGTSAKPKKAPKKAEALAPVQVPPVSPEVALAEEEKIPAKDIEKKLTQPMPADQVAEQFILQVLKPQYLQGKRAWTFRPNFMGRPLTGLHEDWVRALTRAGMDAGNLLIQAAPGALTLRLDGFNGLGRG